MPSGTGSANSQALQYGDAETENLVRLASRGCIVSFSELPNHFRPRLGILLGRFLAGYDSGVDAEDVVQESLFKAFQNLHRYDFNYRFSTWLYTIAFRVARDQLRRNRRWSRLVSLGRQDACSLSMGVSNESELKDQADNIWELAKKVLSGDQYTALWLRYGEDLDIEEVSGIIGKNPGAIRVLLHRSRLRLLEQIQSTESNKHPREMPTKSGATK